MGQIIYFGKVSNLIMLDIHEVTQIPEYRIWEDNLIMLDPFCVFLNFDPACLFRITQSSRFPQVAQKLGRSTLSFLDSTAEVSIFV